MKTNQQKIYELMTAQQLNNEQYANGDIEYGEFNKKRREILADLKGINNEITGGFAMRESVELTQMRVAK